MWLCLPHQSLSLFPTQWRRNQTRHCANPCPLLPLNARSRSSHSENSGESVGKQSHCEMDPRRHPRRPRSHPPTAHFIGRRSKQHVSPLAHHVLQWHRDNLTRGPRPHSTRDTRHPHHRQECYLCNLCPRTAPRRTRSHWYPSWQPTVAPLTLPHYHLKILSSPCSKTYSLATVKPTTKQESTTEFSKPTGLPYKTHSLFVFISKSLNKMAFMFSAAQISGESPMNPVARSNPLAHKP